MRAEQNNKTSEQNYKINRQREATQTRHGKQIEGVMSDIEQDGQKRIFLVRIFLFIESFEHTDTSNTSNTIINH